MIDQETTLRAALRPWATRAAAIVERRIADARMHAAAGSSGVATARLGELHGSLVRHVSDARGHFYRVSFLHHRQSFDAAIHRTHFFSSVAGEAAARDARILGRSYALDFADLVEDAKAGLQSAYLASRDDYPNGGSCSGPHLENWASTHGDRIVARVVQELSDSQIAIFEAVGQILIKPELR